MAFANMAAIETCFKKKTGVFGDYSEQQLVDCGYGGYGNGCNGAPLNAYFKWASDSKADLTAEVPMKAVSCSSNLLHRPATRTRIRILPSLAQTIWITTIRAPR